MNSLIDLSSRVTCFAQLAAALSDVLTVLEQAHADANTAFIDVERQLVDRVRAFGRAATGALLGRWEPRADDVKVDGRMYRRVREATRGHYIGLDGTFEV